MEQTRDSSTTVLYVLAALLLGVGAAWLFLTNREPVEDAPPVAETAPDPAEPQEVSPFDALPAQDVTTTLEMAELALQAGQLFEPEDASALVFFGRVLALEPQHPRAGEAVAEILDEIVSQGEAALRNENYARLEFLLGLLAFDYDDSPQFARLVDAVSAVVDNKFAVVDGATRRGQFVPAAALLEEIATIPTADPVAIAERRSALDDAVAASEAAVGEVDDASPVAAQASNDLPPAADEVASSPDASQVAAADAAVAGAAIESASSESLAAPIAVAVSVEPPAAEPEPAGPSGADSPPTRGEPEPIAEAPVSDPDATDDALATDAEPEPEPEPEDPLVPILALAIDSLAEGRLVTPPNDNAHYYFRQALQLDPENAVATGGLRDVMLGLSRRALDAAENQEWEQADRWLRQAESVDTGPELVDRTRSRVVAMRIAAETQRMIPVSELNTRKIVRPRFPQRALRYQVPGWALLQFTVGTDGTTGEIEIVETSERFGEHFARAARTAVEKWVFEPREFMGQIVQARTQTKVTFDLAD